MIQNFVPLAARYADKIRMPSATARSLTCLTAAAARELKTLRSADPKYQAARDKFLSTGEMRVAGDPSRMGGWLDAVHDPIVDHTLNSRDAAETPARAQGCGDSRSSIGITQAKTGDSRAETVTN
jgi:hypothetical protein